MTERNIERMLRTADEKKRESDAIDPSEVKDHPFVKKAVSNTTDITVATTEIGESFNSHIAGILVDDPDKPLHQQLLTNQNQPPQAA
jgi:hypothetical protein